MKVEKTFTQLACQLSYNSCSRLTRTWELRKLIQTLVCQLSSTLTQLLLFFNQNITVEKTLIDSYKLSLVNSQPLSCKSCSRLTQNTRVEKLSYKLSLVNSHQLLCNSCSWLPQDHSLLNKIFRFSWNCNAILFGFFIIGRLAGRSSLGFWDVDRVLRGTRFYSLFALICC